MEFVFKLKKEETIIKEFQNGKIGFPWMRERIENPRELFNNLQRYIPEIMEKPFTYKYIVWKVLNPNSLIKYKNQKYISIITKKEDYEKIDKLVDYFNEKPRMISCRRDKPCSPMDVWTKRQDILNPWIQTQLKHHKEITIIGLREQLWKMGLECNAFKASLAITIYSIFKAKRILDFSSGWGDRLLAAMAYNVERYLGYDPNPNLQNGYQEMINMFLSSEKKYEIITEAFETSELREEKFDLVFTSPPYFDFETYIRSDNILSITQSIMNYPKFTDWMIYFLFRSLYKCWHYLIPNGNMIIHLSDVYKTNYVEAMILFVLGWCPGSRMDGSIASIGDCAKPRPLWIFHKTSNLTIDLLSVQRMEKYYPELFSELNR
jgi:DNA modification methylase